MTFAYHFICYSYAEHIIQDFASILIVNSINHCDFISCYISLQFTRSQLNHFLAINSPYASQLVFSLRL